MATSRVSKPWNVRPGVRLGHKDEQPGKKEVGVVGTPLFTVRSNAFYDRCAAQPTRLAMAIERAKRYCVVGLLLVTASMRACGRWLARLVARAMLVSPLLRW